MNGKIYVAGHGGMVGAAVVREIARLGLPPPLTMTHRQLDLTDQAAARAFIARHRPDCIIVAAARVGGIEANRSALGTFLYENLMIAANVIHGAFEARELLNLSLRGVHEAIHTLDDGTRGGILRQNRNDGGLSFRPLLEGCLDILVAHEVGGHVSACGFVICCRSGDDGARLVTGNARIEADNGNTRRLRLG